MSLLYNAIGQALIGRGENTTLTFHVGTVHQLTYASDSQCSADILSQFVEDTSPDTGDKLINTLVGMPSHEEIHLDLKWNSSVVTNSYKKNTGIQH